MAAIMGSTIFRARCSSRDEALGAIASQFPTTEDNGNKGMSEHDAHG